MSRSRKQWMAPLYTGKQLPRYTGAPPVAGSLAHFASGDRGYDPYAEVEWIDPTSWRLDGVLLTLKDLHTGRSAKWVTWTDVNGREFPMFIADLISLVRDGNVHRGTTQETFKIAKRGQNFGIALA